MDKSDYQKLIKQFRLLTKNDNPEFVRKNAIKAICILKAEMEVKFG